LERDDDGDRLAAQPAAICRGRHFTTAERQARGRGFACLREGCRRRLAAIVVTPSGDRVFASNRGHDSVACFRVDAATGLLQSVGWVPTQGACPRFMTIDPARSALLVANEQADNIVQFDLADGEEVLRPGERIAQVASPATIVFSTAHPGG
jgi:6-phosphogluconolactonase (cycloisomerase 2 family)